ncbi:oxidoreductase [Capsulimonas corticalis]|uniref:Oxidoreductase n=1 Tax=Capsulimonas corticalis TaxID=2219043 RepID=A0A402CPW3_9BACT|nr:Gfo/Idh/MocA family oxidoreductase [Capsulimonas corticalis]BDI32823.1 oxidoreductase [Capsulimonas corticalis]
MTNTKFRWGIIGLGSIAGQFATGLQSVPDAELAAVASRTQEKADAFGEKFGAAKRYGSYRELAADPDIDAVYIATPHPMHAEDSILCLEAGKAVLTEKPFTINAAQARATIDAARANNVFLMEAMWTRFFPVMVKVRELIASQAIGDLRIVQADFGFRAGVNPEGRLFNPALGGGALLDVGSYCVSLASMLLGAPVQTTGVAHIGETGIDEQAAMLLRYSEGQIAVLSTAVRTNTPQEVYLIGTEGKIHIPSPWWKPSKLTLSRDGQETETLDLPYEGNGYNYQAVEVAECVRAGKTQSSVMPQDETLRIMETMDALRAQWGLKYPMEN